MCERNAADENKKSIHGSLKIRKCDDDDRMVADLLGTAFVIGEADRLALESRKKEEDRT